MQLRSVLQFNLTVDDVLLYDLVREAADLLNLFGFNF